MKKLLFLLLFLTNLHANPVAVPQVTISELYFTDQNTWILELDILGEFTFKTGMFESVFLSSASGMAEIKPGVFKQGDRFFIVNTDSLFSPLSINSKGDCIKVITHEVYPHTGEPLIDSLWFGDSSGSHMTEILSGYSICRLGYDLYVKDKSPTLGFPNDTTGTCSTLKGLIYDIRNELISKGHFYLDSDVYFDNTGEFHTRVYSLHYGKTHLKEVLAPGQYKHFYIDKILINIEPDSVYHHNIYLLSDYIQGIHQNQSPDKDLIVMNYPNPFNSITTFKIKWSSNEPNVRKRICIFDVSGQLINVIQMDNRQNATWDGSNQHGVLQSSGIYFYKLIVGNDICKTGSMILLK